MSIRVKSPLRTILFLEVAIVIFMSLGIAGQELSYLALLIVAIGFLKMSSLDSLTLFIFSIPFFVAFPGSGFSDSMSIWRVLIILLVAKAVWEKYGKANGGKFGDKKKILSIFSAVGAKKPLNLASREIRGALNSSYRALFLSMSAFLGISAVSVLFADDIGAGVKKILFLMNILLLFPLTAYCVKNAQDFLKIIKSIFITSLVVVLIGYFQFLLTFVFSLYSFWQFWAQSVIRALYGQNLSELLSYSNTWFSYYASLPPTLRMFSVLPDSHSFSMLVIIAMPALLLLLSCSQSKKKNYFTAAIILFYLAIFFSGSRGAWITFFAAVVSAFVLLAPYKYGAVKYFEKLNLRPDGKKEARLIVIFVLLFFILMPFSSFILTKNQEIQIISSGMEMTSQEKNALFERAVSISDLSETSNKGRLQIWSRTVSSIAAHPVLGVGYGNYPVILQENISDAKRGSSAHNIYLDVAAETGIFGLAAFLAILGEILRVSYLLFYRLRTQYLKMFAGSFFVFFSWASAYGIFDIVIFNEKVLIVLVIMIGLLYSLEKADLKREAAH